MSEERSITVRLRASIEQYQQAMRQAGAETRQMASGASQRIEQMGPRIEKVGSTMTRTLTPAAVAAGAVFKRAGDQWNEGVQALAAGSRPLGAQQD